MAAEFKIYNTLSRRVEKFEPFEAGLVKMYVCGPTVYDYTHIGHARTYVVFDSLKRYLRFIGYDVIHVQNITDIDDKIIRRAQSEHRDWREIADYYAKDYFECLKRLNISVDIHPRVTSHIKEIIEFIKVLIDKGYAYIAPSGSVYFDVTKYQWYGELSGRKEPELWSQEEEFVREKKNPFDFALWKAWKPGEPYWEAPWGRGRPGWHIECSVMASKYLGSRIDIHGGGQDLVFPHHENERAQSEAYHGVRPWVKYWVHVGMLTVRGEKMSKSLGNIIPLREALNKWSPDVLRLWLLSAQYRRPLDFSEEGINSISYFAQRIRAAIVDLRRLVSKVEPESRLDDKILKTLSEIEKLHRAFHKSLASDFATSEAIAVIGKLVSLVNKDVIPLESYTLSNAALKLFLEFSLIFGVFEDVFTEERVGEDLFSKLVDLIVDVRSELRKMKLYSLADKIRSELATLGIQLLDYPGGKTTWRLVKLK